MKVELVFNDYYAERRAKRLQSALILLASIIGVGVICLFSSCQCTPARAESIDVEKLADAIRIAEGVNSRHPYGILAHYKTTTPRQACKNTILHSLKHFNEQSKEKDFILWLSKTYCPIGASNDPTGLNKNWTRLVKYFLVKNG